MTVWVDAQLSPALARWLTNRFNITAQHVREVASLGGSDREIFEAARAAGAVLLTKDRDFVELTRIHRSPPHVIWVTCGNTSNRAMLRILELTFAAACKMLNRASQWWKSKDKRARRFPPVRSPVRLPDPGDTIAPCEKRSRSLRSL
jgi:predicted nuclease of predicted toxin-antitoxin system